MPPHPLYGRIHLTKNTIHHVDWIDCSHTPPPTSIKVNRQEGDESHNGWFNKADLTSGAKQTDSFGTNDLNGGGASDLIKEKLVSLGVLKN